jgi:hypothetical protein
VLIAHDGEDAHGPAAMGSAKKAVCLQRTLAQLREEATKEERERYRYKLIEEDPSPGRPTPPWSRTSTGVLSTATWSGRVAIAARAGSFGRYEKR